jgi:hypothetical protein
LLPAESALLVLGVALLLWQWCHPAAFLILASGLGVLLVGGTLVAYPNSVPPLVNHWTPAFPAFYVALAVPVGAWITASQSELQPRLRWISPLTIVIALLVLGWCNLNFYFARDNKGLAFLFFPGNEQYKQTTHELFPGGKHGEVTSRRGKHLFYTYVLTPPEAQATQK